MISAKAARAIPVPDGHAWGYARHLANSRTPVTALTLGLLADIEQPEALEVLMEAASENMGWYRRVDEEDDPMPRFQGRL